VGNREGDDLAGGLVVGLVDAAAVAGLGPPLGPPIAAQRRDPRCPGLGARPAALAARPDTSSPASSVTTAYGWMLPRSTPAT
jgi:hypothetical protein